MHSLSQPIARITPELLQQEGTLLLADPPLRAKQNRDAFVELVKAHGFNLTDSSMKEATVMDEGKPDPRTVPITFMTFFRS